MGPSITLSGMLAIYEIVPYSAAQRVREIHIPIDRAWVPSDLL
jgi:hypothetical protein